MKKNLIFATVVLLFSILFSCSKNEASCTFNNASLVGSWNFTTVNDSLGNDILSKLDQCPVGMVWTFTLDSMISNKCQGKNIYNSYKATTSNNKNYINDNEVLNFNCKTMTLIAFVNRPGLFVGTAYYNFSKQ